MTNQTARRYLQGLLKRVSEQDTTSTAEDRALVHAVALLKDAPEGKRVTLPEECWPAILWALETAATIKKQEYRDEAVAVLLETRMAIKQQLEA
jgi:hypothetical protein